MRYRDYEIKENLERFIDDTNQPELQYVISFCLGYYGYITGQIWRVICEMIVIGKIKS